MQSAQLLEEDLAHEALFEEHYGWLVEWALRLTEGKHSEAEDLVHDLFIQLVRLRPRLHPDPDRVRGYLYTMLRNMHLSKLRRAQRSPICELSVVDYDSLEQGLRSTPERSASAVWTELWRICEYACERKKSSRSASVLILRFFLAYFPNEIARILKTTRVPVDKYLHTARREARLCVSRPSALRIFGQKRSAREVPAIPEESREFFLALRHHVFLWREGSCFSKETLQRVYAPGSSESLSTSELAHLVSCPECLDALNRILGIRLLADRCPSKTLGRDGGPPKSGGSGSGSGISFGGVDREAIRRLEEENEHRPDYLQVAINGEINTSQKITSEFSEFHVKVGRNPALEFLEIFSEQNIRLLYLAIRNSSNPGHDEERASIQLSDGRSLEVAASFSGDSPAIRVRYHDPLFAESEAMFEPALLALLRADTRSGRAFFDRNAAWRRGLREVFAAALGFRGDTWPVGAMASITTAILIAAALVVLHHSGLPRPPADLLQQASQRESASEVAPQDLVRRTIQIQQLGPSGLPVAENSVEEWVSGDAQSRARRLHDHKGTLVAEEITRGNHTKFYGKVEQREISRLNPAHLHAQDVWQITPSAKQFQEIIAPAGPSAIQQENDHYEIRYRQPSTDGHIGLVEATLVLRRKDLHPVEEDLVLRGDGGLSRFRLVESSYGYYSPSLVQKNIFVPDEELSESSPPNSAPKHSLGAAPIAEVSPEHVIHALYLLSLVGADMNRETSVQATPNGILRITGTIATRDRLSEILRALYPLRTQSWVEIRLQTTDQLPASGKAKEGSQTVEVIEPAESAIPLDRQVRRFLGVPGTPAPEMDKGVQRFSQQILEEADEAQQHAWALDLISKRFTPAQLGILSPEARSEWIQMVGLHSSALLHSVHTIRTELAHLAPLHEATPEKVEPIATIRDLSSVADQLLKLSRSNDQVLASAFTLSGAPGGNEVLNQQRFWQSLELQESLARETAATEQILSTAAARNSR